MQLGAGIKSKVSAACALAAYHHLMLHVIDEELLRYGLPTDIWFHVEYVLPASAESPR